MNARCALLAHPIAGLTAPALRCPSTPFTFHYHGHDPKGPFRPMVPGRPCRHRHDDINAAVRCTDTLDRRSSTEPSRSAR